MKKSLAILVGLGIAGCSQNYSSVRDGRILASPQYTKPAQMHDVPGNIKGGEVQIVDNTQAQFSAEFKIIHQHAYAATENERMLPDEESWMLQRWDDIELVRNDYSRESRLESEAFYIPRRVVNSKGLPATSISLALDRLKATSAQIEGFKARGLDIGIATLANEDVSYSISTLIVGDGDFAREYFFPAVESAKIDPGAIPEKLDFYLMPVEGTLIKTRLNDGRITLENPEGVITRPVRVSRQEYESRLSSLSSSPSSGKADELEFTPLDFGNKEIQAEEIK